MGGGIVTSFSHLSNNTKDKWWQDPCLKRNVLHGVGISFAVYYLGYDQSLLTGLQAMPQWQSYFNHPTGGTLGIMTAIIFFPAIVTAFLGDVICNTLGRRWSLRTGAALIIVGAIFNTFVTSTGQLIGARAIIGAGGAVTKVAAPCLLQEIIHPRLRARVNSLYYCFAYVGGATAAWLSFGCLYIPSNWSWRFPSLFQIVGPIFVIGVTFLCPESPRWLMSKGRNEEALTVLANYHANGDENDELVQFEYSEIRNALIAEETGHKVSYLDFFRTPANRRRFFVICLISIGTNWVGNGVVSYYLSPILKLVGVTKPVEISAINGCLAIWNLILSSLASQNVERVGRRPLWLTSTAGMLFSYVIITALSATFANTKHANVGVAVIPFLFIFFGFYDMAWTPLCYSYSAEILPFHMRSKGLAIFVSVQNAALAFNNYVNPIGLKRIGWKYYSVYIATTFVIFWLAYFFFPETKGLTIEEISFVFDQGGRPGRINPNAAKLELQQKVGGEVDMNEDIKEEPSKSGSVV